MRPQKIVSFKSTPSIRIMLRQYITLLNEAHKLSPKEIELLSEFIYEFLSRRKDFANIEDLWEKVFHYTTKREIKDRLEIEDQVLQTRLSQLRKKGAVKNNRINGLFIPALSPGKDGEFDLVFRLKYEWV